MGEQAGSLTQTTPSFEEDRLDLGTHARGLPQTGKAEVGLSLLTGITGAMATSPNR